MSDTPQHRKVNYLGHLTIVIPLLGTVLWFSWSTGVTVTKVQDALSHLSWQVDQSNALSKSDVASARSDYMERLTALGQRVTALEAAKTTADQQQAQTTAAISGLKAQTDAIQSSLNDLRDGIRSIQQDIGQMARTANAPLPRR